jgi:hypothetical protein
MRTATEKQVRALLRANSDGLTLTQINESLKRNEANLRVVLRSMPDSYIDRWEPRKRKAHAAVWCVVVPPEDCPRPQR